MKYYKPMLIAVSGAALGVVANPFPGFRLGLALAPGRTDAAETTLDARNGFPETLSSEDAAVVAPAAAPPQADSLHFLQKHYRPLYYLLKHRSMEIGEHPISFPLWSFKGPFLPAPGASETEARDFYEDLVTRGRHGGKQKKGHGGKHKKGRGGGKHKKGRGGGKHKKGKNGGKHKKGRHGHHKRRLAQVPTDARDFDQDLDARMVIPSGTDAISPPALNGAHYRILRRHSGLAERDSLDGEYDLAGRGFDYEMDELD